MIHPFDSMRRWWNSGGPPASVDADGLSWSNGNGAEHAIKPPEPPWLAQIDKAGLPRNVVYPGCTLGRLVDHAAERYGDATAIVYGEQKWTYRELLAQVQVPTLVMHVRGDLMAPIDAGRQMAAAIPGARFVALPGRNHLFLKHEPAAARFFDEINLFLSK